MANIERRAQRLPLGEAASIQEASEVTLGERLIEDTHTEDLPRPDSNRHRRGSILGADEDRAPASPKLGTLVRIVRKSGNVETREAKMADKPHSLPGASRLMEITSGANDSKYRLGRAQARKDAGGSASARNHGAFPSSHVSLGAGSKPASLGHTRSHSRQGAGVQKSASLRQRGSPLQSEQIPRTNSSNLPNDSERAPTIAENGLSLPASFAQPSKEPSRNQSEQESLQKQK